MVISTLKSNRSRMSVAATLAGALMFCGWIAPASAGQRHVIKVTTSPYAKTKWSVYADLYDGKGRHVYHWQETNKKGGKGNIRWEFTDGGDGGWVHLWVRPGPAQQFFYQALPLNRNHCYRITEPILVGIFSKVVKEPGCPF